jgi:hypothetical protein
LHRDKSTGKSAQKREKKPETAHTPSFSRKKKEIKDKIPFLSFGGKIKNPS